MELFTDDVKNQLSGLLQQMAKPVKLLFFTQEFECRSCKDARTFASEFSSLSEKLSMRVYDFQKDSEETEAYKVERIPAYVLLDDEERDRGIKFYGIPGGYEINSFLTSILEISGKLEDVDNEVLQRIKGIDKKVHIQVFVTLGCPYCPAAVVTAHRLALENPLITADMVESSTFPHLAVKYNVQGVPKIIINETGELTGAQPITAFLDAIESLS